MERTIGSVAFTAAPRAVWGVAPEMDEEGEPTGRNIMTRIKGNLAPDIGGLAYEIEGIKLDSEDYPARESYLTSRIKWHEGAILLTADQVYDPASGGEDAGEKSALEDAIDWLRDMFLNGIARRQHSGRAKGCKLACKKCAPKWCLRENLKACFC